MVDGLVADILHEGAKLAVLHNGKRGVGPQIEVCLTEARMGEPFALSWFQYLVQWQWDLYRLSAGNDGIYTSFDVAATFTAVAAVPEPSTWAMMVLGFAGVGCLADRRRRSSSAFPAA